MDKNETAIPLACVPGAIPAEVRTAHFARLRRLFDTLAEDRTARPVRGHSSRPSWRLAAPRCNPDWLARRVQEILEIGYPWQHAWRLRGDHRNATIDETEMAMEFARTAARPLMTPPLPTGRGRSFRSEGG